MDMKVTKQDLFGILHPHFGSGFTLHPFPLMNETGRRLRSLDIATAFEDSIPVESNTAQVEQGCQNDE